MIQFYGSYEGLRVGKTAALSAMGSCLAAAAYETGRDNRANSYFLR